MMKKWKASVTDDERAGIRDQQAMIAETNKHFGDEIKKRAFKWQPMKWQRI